MIPGPFYGGGGAGIGKVKPAAADDINPPGFVFFVTLTLWNGEQRGKLERNKQRDTQAETTHLIVSPSFRL